MQIYFVHSRYLKIELGEVVCFVLSRRMVLKLIICLHDV
jgi:hypothetical protein